MSFYWVLLALMSSMAYAGNMTLVELSTSGGAVCLDGSPAAYYWLTSSSQTDFIIYFEGGGWCYTEEQCLSRSMTWLGSSAKNPQIYDPVLGGFRLLSNDPISNPDFAGFNKVLVRYCDGASFSGDVAQPVTVGGKRIFMRGKKILDALLDHLISTRGLSQASRLMISGCSAGALTTYLHCDYIRDSLPTVSDVKCMADAGFFTDLMSINGKYIMRTNFQHLFTTHNLDQSLDQTCQNAYHGQDSWKCIFPQYALPFIETPIFVVNSAYDYWHMCFIWFATSPFDQLPDEPWRTCCTDIKRCTPKQMLVVQRYHRDTLNALQPAAAAFIDSCFTHCQTSYPAYVATISNQTLGEAMSQWFFNPPSKKKIMCPYPCHEPTSTCTWTS